MAENEEPNHDDRALRARLDKLSSALSSQRDDATRLKAKRASEAEFGQQAGQGMSLGLRVVADLLGGILVGMAIGWGLDRWLSTSPLMLIVFLFLGTAAGTLNVMRAAGRPPKGNSDRGGS
jgi:ATP synthase protein I